MISQAQYVDMLTRLNRTAPSSHTPCEREFTLHEQIEDYCRAKGWLYVHSRTDKASTNQVGTPDFIIAADEGRTFWIECKRKNSKPTSVQLGMIAWLKKLRHVAAVVWSFDEFLEVVKSPNHLG